MEGISNSNKNNCWSYSWAGESEMDNIKERYQNEVKGSSEHDFDFILYYFYFYFIYIVLFL